MRCGEVRRSSDPGQLRGRLRGGRVVHGKGERRGDRCPEAARCGKQGRPRNDADGLGFSPPRATRGRPRRWSRGAGGRRWPRGTPTAPRAPSRLPCAEARRGGSEPRRGGRRRGCRRGGRARRCGPRRARRWRRRGFRRRSWAGSQQTREGEGEAAAESCVEGGDSEGLAENFALLVDKTHGGGARDDVVGGDDVADGRTETLRGGKRGFRQIEGIRRGGLELREENVRGCGRTG